MKRRVLVLLGVAAWSSPAAAEDLRFHVSAGAAHAVGPHQQREFGPGGTGEGTIELPATTAVGVQASAGAIVLGQGAAPSDPSLQRSGTGAAYVGTLGIRVRPLAASRVAGPYIDANGGIALTGDATRPAASAHLGWDFRIAKDSRVDFGPFIGYTHILQPNAELRDGDARVLSVGLALSLGAKEPKRPALAPRVEPGPPPPPADQDKDVEAVDICNDGEEWTAEDGCGPDVRLVEDRILLDDVIHFDFDSARIQTRSHRLVRKVAQLISAHADIISVSIEGHADAVGSDQYNQKLSEARAASTRELLVRFGVASEQLHVVAHGKSKPVIATQHAEARNRRVEFFVTRTHEEPKQSGRAKVTTGTRGMP